MPRQHRIATVCRSGMLPDKADSIAAARFDAVDIFEDDLLGFDGTARDPGRMCAGLGLAVTLCQPFSDLEAMPGPHRARNFRAERKSRHGAGRARAPILDRINRLRQLTGEAPLEASDAAALAGLD